MKERYVLGIAFVILLMVFAFSAVAAKTNPDQNFVGLKEETITLFEMDKMTYGQCIKLDKSIWNNCLDAAKAKLKTCTLEAEKDDLKLEVCEDGYGADKKSCKNSFKNIKDNCALNRKTLIERIKALI